MNSGLNGSEETSDQISIDEDHCYAQSAIRSISFSLFSFSLLYKSIYLFNCYNYLSTFEIEH